MEYRSFTRRAGDIEYVLTRKPVKNLNMRLGPEGSLRVSASPRVPLSQVDQFVESHRDWILRSRQRLAQQESRRQGPLPDKQAALAEFILLSERYFPLFAHVLEGERPQIKVREMTSRWGVCNRPKRQLTFALQLAAMPQEAKEYVVVHEYCHFLVPNHSPAFWAQVEKILPDWKERRRLLR